MLDTIFAIETANVPSANLVESNAADLMEDCLARADLYRMLAGVFVEEPNPAFIAAMREPGLLGHLAEAGIVFGSDFLDADEKRLDDALACEYATLFASSGGFPPVESVRLTGRFKQEPHFQVERIYREAGFALSKGRFEVFPDQLGVELLFVAELLNRCVQALNEDRYKDYQQIEKDIKRFWTLHLGRWVRGYSRLIEHAADHSFYREMARFLGGFAEEELAAMNLKHIDDLDQGRAVVPKSEIKVEFNPDEPVCGACPSGPREGASPAKDSVHRLHDLRL